MLLRATVGAGRDQLDDADPLAVRQRQQIGQVEARIAGRGCVHAAGVAVAVIAGSR